jgi:hypothetical protein
MRWHGIQKVEIPIVSNMMKLWNNSRIFLIVLIARVKVTKSGFVYRLTKELSEMGRKMSSLINVDISYFILCSTQQSRAKKKQEEFSSCKRRRKQATSKSKHKPNEKGIKIKILMMSKV